MAEKLNLVGKKVNLAKLTDLMETNNHKLKVCEFLNAFYSTMSSLEANNPIVVDFVKFVGEEMYSEYICTVVFELCIRLSAKTLSKEAFDKLIEKATTETVDLSEELGEKA